jgi:hypothetical protein
LRPPSPRKPFTVYLPSAKEAGRAGEGAGVGVGSFPGRIAPPGVAAGAAPTAVPHESQNRAAAFSTALHEAHFAASVVPHASQKRAPSRFSLPQDEQVKGDPPALRTQ